MELQLCNQRWSGLLYTNYYTQLRGDVRNSVHVVLLLYALREIPLLTVRCTHPFYSTVRMARATLILRGVGIVSVILLFALLTQRLDKHGEEQRWNTPAFQQIQQKGWNSVHKTIRNHHETSAPQCSVQKSAMPWIRENREIYMVFYGKPIMQVLAEIGTSRGWKIRHIQGDSLEGQNEFKNLISPERLLFVVATSQAYRLDFVMALAKSTNALIGAIGNASKVTGTKQTQIISFRNHFQSFGCSLEATGIMPRSFVIDNPKECKNFFHYGRKRPQSLWVLKPVSGQGGNGITIHSNLTFFYKEYAKCSKRHKYIIQEYISNPLLLNKRKFDIRAYMLIAKTSPHYLVFYHKGQLRLSSKEFDIHGNRDVHLTNTNVQIHLEDYISEDHFWRFQDLQEYLNEHRPEDGKDFVSKTLVPFIQRIGTLIAHTG